MMLLRTTGFNSVEEFRIHMYIILAYSIVSVLKPENPMTIKIIFLLWSEHRPAFGNIKKYFMCTVLFQDLEKGQQRQKEKFFFFSIFFKCIWDKKVMDDAEEDFFEWIQVCYISFFSVFWLNFLVFKRF
jgi:hypothetical protein